MYKYAQKVSARVFTENAVGTFGFSQLGGKYVCIKFQVDISDCDIYDKTIFYIHSANLAFRHNPLDNQQHWILII